MRSVREKIAHAAPWIEPILDYFDWRKRVFALAAGLTIGVWSFLKDLPWPVIVVLAFGMLVLAAYALAFPAFLRLVNVGVRPRPNHSIWKHKKEFALIQAAFLLADREPSWNTTALDGDAAAWYEGLYEAIRKGEIKHVPDANDQRHTNADGFQPQMYTLIAASELRKFCAARDRRPEFLR